MAFFLPSSTSTSTSTTTSLASSPPPVLRSLESEEESEQSHNESTSVLGHRSDDILMAPSRFTMFGLFNRRIDYLSGAELSSLEEDSESEVESSWTRRATFGDDDSDTEARSTRERGSPSKRRLQTPEPIAGTSQSVHQTRRISESNIASSTNQIEREEALKRRRSSPRRHRSSETDRSTRRRAKLRNRRGHVVEAFISRDFFLIITLCFGLACAWIVLARPIMMNWFRSRSGDGYMYMDG